MSDQVQVPVETTEQLHAGKNKENKNFLKKKGDHLTDCFTCGLLNEVSLVSQTFLGCTTTAILHMDTHGSTSPCTKGEERTHVWESKDFWGGIRVT